MPTLNNIINRGFLTREVDEFPDGITNDGIMGFTIDGKNFIRNSISNIFRSVETGIYADGTNMRVRLETVLNSSFVKVLEIDSGGTGSITLNGTVNIPSGKILRFLNGTKFTGTYTLSGGIIDANPNDPIFDGNPTISGIEGTVDGTFYVTWLSTVADGATDDASKITKALGAPVKRISFNVPGIYYCNAVINIPAGKVTHFTPGAILKFGASGRIGFSGAIEVDDNQYFIDPSVPAISIAINSIQYISVKWTGATGDGVTDDTLAVSKAAAGARNSIAGSLNNRVPLYFPNGRYRCDNIYVISDVRGDGSNTILQSYTEGEYALMCGYADSGYPNAAWRFHTVSNMTILGGTVSNAVSNGIVLSNNGNTPGNQYAGRWVFDKVNFVDCLKGIAKIAGNIGNRYIDCTFTRGEYHYHAVQNVSPVMHTGNDYFYHCHFTGATKSCVYIDQSQNGGGHHFNDCIMESNPGFAVFIKSYGNALFPFVFENVYLEGNGSASVTNIDGVDYTGNFVYYFGNSKNIFLRATAIMKRMLSNAVVIWEGCNEYIDKTPPVKDEYSFEYSTKGFGFQLSYNSVFHLDPPYSDPDASNSQIWRCRLPQSVCQVTPNVKITLSGTNPDPATWVLLNAGGITLESDSPLFEKSWNVPSSVTPTNVNVNSTAGSGVVASGKFYYVSCALKKISGTANAKVTFVNNLSTVFETDSTEWVYFNRIRCATTSGPGYFQINKDDVEFRIACVQYIEFNSFQEAYEYAVRNCVATKDKVSNLSWGVHGGQTLTGGNGAYEILTLSSTSNATKGSVNIDVGDVLKLPAQTLRGTPEEGAFEFDGDDLYYDFSSSLRRKIQMNDSLSGSITTDSSILLPAGGAVTGIVLSSSSAQSNLLVGTSPGGSELGSVDFSGGDGTVILTGVYGTGSNSIYFTNISGTVDYKINLTQ